MREVSIRTGAALLAGLLVSACSGGGAQAVSGPASTPFALTGGKGSAGAGGRGGSFDLQGYGGGDIRIETAGAVNTAVTPPAQLPYLGANWQDVTADATLDVGATGFRLAAGATAVSNATGPVTGIRVRPGATLTVKPNWNAAGLNPALGPRNEVQIVLSDGLIVEGTVRIAVKDGVAAGDGAGTDTANFRILGMGGLYVGAGGRIDVSGADNAAGPGRNGGAFQASTAAANNLGAITTKGGAGTSAGGSGGPASISATSGYVASSGSIVTDGGVASAGGGGSAGSQALTSSGSEFVLARGLLSAAGGNGAGAGGAGGNLSLVTTSGDIVSDATVRTSGGDATSAGPGGNGGSFSLTANGAARIAGSIDTRGGKGAGAGNGGNGGNLDLQVRGQNTWSGGMQPDSGAIYFGAGVSAGGGDGAAGGSAGHFYAYGDSQGASAKGAPLQLVGYSAIDLSGGDGTTLGGDAGGVNRVDCWWAYDTNWIYRGCGVHNAASFTMRGGSGSAAGSSGGAGAGIEMQTSSDLYPPYDYGTTNLGALDGSGGNGAANGGAGGSFSLFGAFFLDSSGAITSRGGDGGTGLAGAGGRIDLRANASLASSGSLDVKGGGSTSGTAGGGGQVSVSAAKAATLSSAVAANGGDSASGAGGSGGYVWVMSQAGASTVGSISAGKGTGATGTPSNGQIWIDGMQVAGP